jgi:hypothetical protein
MICNRCRNRNAVDWRTQLCGPCFRRWWLVRTTR